MADPEHDSWLQVLGVSPVSFAAGAKPESDDDRGPSDNDPAHTEREQRDRQQDEATQPAGDRVADAAKDLLTHYASQHLGPLRDQALQDLSRAWRESPGGVIAAGTVIGAAGIAYLVGTGASIPSIPAIPLDFLAGRAPVLRGAELNIQVTGPITGPDSFRVSITFHEQVSSGPAHASQPGRGRVFTPRLTLRPGGAVAASPEPGSDLSIEGQVPIPSDATADDVAATTSAIQDGNVEVDIGGTPAGTVRVLSVADNYKPDRFGLAAPPVVRFLTVRLRTTIPPMFHQGADETVETTVNVRINRTGSEGAASIRVHYQPFPPQE